MAAGQDLGVCDGADAVAAGDAAPLPVAQQSSQLDDQVDALCPQLSDPLDDTPMMGYDDSDNDFM